MPAWKGIVGAGFTADEFDQYLRQLKIGPWRPKFVVLHNTQSPTFAEWHSIPAQRRINALESYYRDDQGWSGGPHLFVADDRIWVFTPLTVPGVHSPSWNAVALGVEIVGDYDNEPLTEGVKKNVIRAVAALHIAFDLNPDTLKLHKEDPKTSHDFCPGRNVDKAAIVNGVKERIVSIAVAPIT